MENIIGSVLNDRYEILELIGVGGMAVVYRAYDRIDDRVAAVKILKDEYLADEDFRMRFKNESKAISLLSHPNIVRVYDYYFGTSLQYIVMEYVDGITLREFLNEHHRLPWQQAVSFVTQILRALQHAHDKGIVHRDIKPENIMLLENGTLKVTDFGIARFNRNEALVHNDDGSVIGSVHYISPEQARGEYTDDKADIYSVGIVLYEMLTGRLPYDAPDLGGIAVQQQSGALIPPQKIVPDIPIGLEQITLRAMRVNPADRFQSAVEFLLDLEEFKRNPVIKFDYQVTVAAEPTKYLNDTGRIASRPAADQNTSDFATLETTQSERALQTDSSDNSPAKKSMTLPVLLGIVIGVVVIGVIIGLVLYFSSNKEIEVPNFINMSYTDVQTQYPGWNFETAYEYNSNFANDAVCEQTPAAGEKVAKGTTVKITIAKNGETINVLNVVGYKYTDAKEQLENVSFDVVLVAEYSDTVAEGIVIRTDPQAGEALAYHGVVTVYYATSENTAVGTVPSVVGDELDIAKQKITDAGFTVGTVSKEASAASLKGYVIKQSPSADSSVNTETPVNLVVGSGVPSSASTTFTVTLPSISGGSTGTVKIYINDVLVDEKDDVTLDGSSYKATLSGSGKNNDLEVYISGILIVKGKIDFTSSPVSVYDLTKYDFSARAYVPDVVGLTEEQAREALRTAGFTDVSVKTEYSDSVSQGLVIYQEPDNSDTRYSTSETVTIHISLGPRPTTPPATTAAQPATTTAPATTAPAVTTTAKSGDYVVYD